MSFHFTFYQPLLPFLGLHCLFYWPLTDTSFLRPLRAGTRRSLFGEASALADISAMPLTCWRLTLNTLVTGLRPAAVGRLRGLFYHWGALTTCA